jgi:hypothetical protein
MVRRPGLFNEAAATFYRSTEEVARRRAVGRGTIDEPLPETPDAGIDTAAPDETAVPAEGGRA